MKKLSIALACVLVAIISCTKSKEVHPKIGDGNDEIVTVGMNDIHVEYTRTDHTELNRVVFHCSLAEVEQFAAVEMIKRETFFELTINDLLSDTLYCYYFELFSNGGSAYQSEQKTFHTQAFEVPEPPTPPVAELPTVVTVEVSEITTNSAICGGEVTNEGGSEVIERGICWSTHENPTLGDNHIAIGSGMGSFTTIMNDLQANTIYHVRAYATNMRGTAYGLDREFVTISGGGGGNGGDVPEGAVNGKFSIDESGSQVYFSKGNLQYIGSASTPYWKFADKQWDYIGEAQNGDSQTIDRDLFGWGTSGYNHGAVAYQPWSTSTNYSDYWAYGNWELGLNFVSGQADWGYNAISNGGNTEGQWRMLSHNEYVYLFHQRPTLSGIRFVKANVNGVNGVVLLPDNWDVSTYELNYAIIGENYYSNIISAPEWMNTLEANGAVFLPAAGSRIGETVYHASDYGYYWLANCPYNKRDAFEYFFYSNDFYTGSNERCYGHSVRLVRDVE